MFSKSLIQFSVDGWGRVPSLLFTWGQTTVEVMKIIGTSSKGSIHALLHSVPQHCRRTLPTQASARDYGHSWASLGQSLVGSLLRSPGSLFCLCPPRVYFPVLCKFWWLCGGVNGDLLQEGLCHSQVYCTQSPCPCGRPLLTHTPTGDTQTLKGRSDGSVSVDSPGAHQVLFELSNHLWQVWDLILNAILSFLLSCWGFSFALARAVCFVGGIQNSPVNSCSAMVCNFGVLVGEDERMSFYSTHVMLLKYNCRKHLLGLI